MQSGRQFPHNKADLDPGNRPVGTYAHAQVAPMFPPGAKRLAPLHGFEFHPSEVCPKNFIIFDQTDNRSQIMFHPGIAHKFAPPSFNFRATCFQGGEERNEANDSDRESSSYPLEEDSDDIDALLYSGDEYERDEEEVSTARTHDGNCADTASSYGEGYDYERKRQKMRKMVKALRGIIPGGDQMDDTTSVIDEAVKYLKSLKVEAQKLGVGNLED